MTLIKTSLQITDGVTVALDAIRSKIQEDISSANKIIAGAVSGINKVASLVDVTLSVPQFDIPSLNALQNVTIPTGFEDDLRRLNASIPSLDELRDVMTNLIEIPFEKMKAELNSTFGELIGNVTTASLPTMRNSASLAARPDEGMQICKEMDVSFVDDVAASLAKIARVGTALIILGFFLLWVALLLWEWYNWKVMKEQAEYLESRMEQDIQAGGCPDGMVMVHIVEHPLLEKYAEITFERFKLEPKTRRNLRWFCKSIFLMSLRAFTDGAFSRVHLPPTGTRAVVFRSLIAVGHPMPDRGNLCFAKRHERRCCRRRYRKHIQYRNATECSQSAAKRKICQRNKSSYTRLAKVYRR
jgi:hypothetical protein